MNTPAKDKVRNEIKMHLACIRELNHTVTIKQLAKAANIPIATFHNAIHNRSISLVRLAMIRKALREFREKLGGSAPVFTKKRLNATNVRTEHVSMEIPLSVAVISAVLSFIIGFVIGFFIMYVFHLLS